METINERIRELREDADLYQKEIALVLEMTEAHYARMERGERAFTVSHIVKLCEYYQVSADYILGLPKDLKWPR